MAPANVNDSRLLAATLDAIVVERPESEQHLCLDKGYDTEEAEQAAITRGYVPHMRRIGEEKLDEQDKPTHPARRWVVERTLGWLSRCRGLLVRYERKSENYLGLLQWACALLWYRRIDKISQPGYVR